MAEISADDVIRAAATPEDARARAEAITELNLGAQAEYERLADETRRAHRIAELAARMTHCIDGAPLEICVASDNPETIEFRHLLDASRWAVYTPAQGRFRLWRRASGDLNATAGEDFDHADEAEAAALAWILRR
jgi:hypothetical protein